MDCKFIAPKARGIETVWLRNLLLEIPIGLDQCHQFLCIMAVLIRYHRRKSKPYIVKSKYIELRYI